MDCPYVEAVMKSKLLNEFIQAGLPETHSHIL